MYGAVLEFIREQIKKKCMKENSKAMYVTSKVKVSQEKNE
jgi:hypothetical protein